MRTWWHGWHALARAGRLVIVGGVIVLLTGCGSGSHAGTPATPSTPPVSGTPAPSGPNNPYSNFNVAPKL